MKKQDISRTLLSENREVIVFSFLFCIVFMFLTGCANSPGDGTQNQGNAAIPITRTPSVGPTATEYDPIQKFLDRVTCQPLLNTAQDFDHWADELIPGVSTVDDLLALKSIREERQPDRTGGWQGSVSFDVYATFSDGILVARSDPRTKLGEIVAHYGLPESVVWQTPTDRNDHPVAATFLVYPEHLTVFWVSQRVTRFTPNTEFDGSSVSIEEIFLADLSSFETDRFDQYIESDWPCEE